MRGLESSDKKYIVKRFLGWNKNIDILLLQEVKSIGFTLDIELKCIWKDAATFLNRKTKGKGGSSPSWPLLEKEDHQLGIFPL